MTITDSVRATIISAARKRGMSKGEVAEIVGHKPAWATKLFDGTLKSLTDEHVTRLEDALEIKFFRLTRSNKEVSGLGFKVSEATKESPELLRAIESVMELHEKQVFTPPYFTTKQLVGLGEEIIRLAHAEQDKPGKVGRKVLELVSQDPNKRKRKGEKYPMKED